MPPKSSEQILTTAFYGESDVWPKVDEVHCEHLQERSARHDWKIEPHRHFNLIQIFYLMEGKCDAEIDHQSVSLSPGDVLIIPEQCVHGFNWKEGSNGYVLFIARPMLNRLEEKTESLPWCKDTASIFKIGAGDHYFATTMATLLDEYLSSQYQRPIMLENLTLSLVVRLNRQYIHQAQISDPERNKLEQRLEHFLEKLDKNFTQQHGVDWYAQKIGITAAHLNTICKKLRQQTALSIIHERILREAQRNLIYTTKTVAQIAEDLGFEDPAYFNRFFKRNSGTAPGSFRKTWNSDE